jgi:hypothetical protein
MTHCEWVKPMANEQVYPRLNHPVIFLYDAAEGELKGIIVGEITCSELPTMSPSPACAPPPPAPSAPTCWRAPMLRAWESSALRPGEKSSARDHAGAQAENR